MPIGGVVVMTLNVTLFNVYYCYEYQRVLIGLAFTCLVLATAGERFVFKYTVDTLTPYRYGPWTHSSVALYLTLLLT